ncbi:MAG: hypothetical protein B7Z13_07035 [Caulobacterales bacterium 32-67-6]|nr:MAG: hypothetical protein B7Z13_07035 [Caulobacterales bacterium 32-67-6]
MMIQIPVSAGELIDKITILEVKSVRMSDPAKLANVRRELEALEAERDRALGGFVELEALAGALRSVNGRLWDIEDGKRACEARGDFGADFIALARLVYKLNDHRADLKRQINQVTGSQIVEEKSHPTYDRGAPDA